MADSNGSAAGVSGGEQGNKSPAVLLAEIAARLKLGTAEAIREAGRLCLGLPEGAGNTQKQVDEARYSTAFDLERQGDAELAAELYRRTLECESSEPARRADAGFRLAAIRETQKQYDESIRLYRHVLAQDAPSPTVVRLSHQQLAGLLVLERRFADALPHIEALLADPEYQGPLRLFFWFRYLQCLLKTGGFALSPEALAEGLPAPGGQVEELTVGIWTEVAQELELTGFPGVAKDLYVRLLEMDGVPGVVRTNCCYRAGLTFESLAQWDQSLRYYEKAIHAPDAYPAAQAHARLRLAELLLLWEDFDAARDHFRMLMASPELSPRRQLECQLRYAVSLLRSGRTDEARRELEACRERATRHAGLDVKADLLLAELFEAGHDFKSARACYERILNNSSSEPQERAGALLRLGDLRRVS
jgi:tetratricopeptide (TPR) repeat protein